MASGEDIGGKESELVLGLVGPVGTEFDKFCDKLKTALSPYGYRTNEIRISDLAVRLTKPKYAKPRSETEAQRIRRLMDAGDAVRRRKADVLALAAANQISQGREEENDGKKKRLRKVAHVMRSLKHPDEVRMLRRLYGPGFFLIGVVTSLEHRIRYLEDEKGCSRHEIDELFKRDEHGGEAGQRTRDTFQLADLFVHVEDVPSLQRFLRLMFAGPYDTPDRDEHAMFLAFSSALRSADLSRQVGAVVTSSRGDVIGVGMNDVPMAGGGLCWPGRFDYRDHHVGYDTNERRRTEIVDELIECLRPPEEDVARWRARGWVLVSQANPAILDITEYGRAVHAEMEALLSCARSGTSTVGGTLYSTTFPCHNCAKHIIAAGIRRVVYVEPYPKSQASEFYAEMIDVKGSKLKVPPIEETAEASTGDRTERLPEEAPDRVRFDPFVGVGPRRFLDLFSVGLSSGLAVKRKDAGGKRRPWTPESANVRVPLLPNSYLIREALAAEILLSFRNQGEHLEKESRTPRRRR